MTLECVEFKGAYFENGYGAAYDKLTQQKVGAHRVAWQNKHGKIGKGLVVMHLCDNRACVNIEHLSVGTQKDNIRDMFFKGRNPYRKGSKSPTAKLTEVKVINILHLIRSGYSQKEVAGMYGVCPSNISKIFRGHHWTHVFKGVT